MNNNPYEASHETAVEPVQRQRKGSPLVAVFVGIGITGILVGLLLPATRTARPAARRMACSNHLRQIALALHNYHATHGSLPPAYTVDESGERLHSWRVLLLPFLEEQKLYEAIDLTKPWDDPANLAAGSRMPSIFHCPSSRIDSGMSTYQVIVAPDGCFPGSDSRRFSEITDGLPNTVMVIESSNDAAVHWMSPQDAGLEFFLGFGAETAFAHLSGTHVVLADGAVIFLTDQAPEALRLALVSVDGGEDLSANAE